MRCSGSTSNTSSSPRAISLTFRWHSRNWRRSSWNGASQIAAPSWRRSYGRPRLANEKPCPFAVLGLGKFGGRELGYASDIEVLFVYGGSGSTNGKDGIENSEYFERLAQELLGWIEAKQEGIFRIDVRLRPHGGKGALANAFEEICRYYSPTGLAAPFERQALIKLRHIAGDSALGHQLETHRDSFVYGDAPWDIPTALELRRQQLRQLVAAGEGQREI